MTDKDKFFKEDEWRLKIFDSLSYPTLIMDLNKIIIGFNNVFLEKYGSKRDVVGKTCHEYFFGTKNFCSIKGCPIPSILSEKKSKPILVKVDYNGREAWEDRDYSPILNENGDVIFFRVSIHDVTQLKVLEKELKETKNFLENMIQSSASSIIAADIKGNVLLMNKAAEDLIGYTQKQFAEKYTAKDFYPPGVAKGIMRKLRSEKYGGKGKLTNTKIDLINAKGEKIPGEIAAAIIYEGGKEVATMGIYTDQREKIAVERKLLETQKQLVQTEKMASIGQLASGVAHEINNPLTGILFYANMLLESRDEDDPVREDLKFIIEDVNRCKEIVKDLLTYSRQTNPAKEFIQLNTLVEEGMSFIHDQKLFGNVKEEKILSDEMMLINVDKNQFYQVIINLVINAGDAMGGKGTLTVHTYRDKARGEAYIEISDTGSGISENDLPNIFDPFFTTKSLGKGTGLGLSTAFGIIKENGGNITVKETSPKGTTFLIKLPLFSHLNKGINDNDAENRI